MTPLQGRMMTRQRAKRESRRHRGVRLLVLRDGRHVARWREPGDGTQKQLGLDKLGLTNDDLRRRWAVEKARQLASLREAISLGRAHAVRVSPEEAVAEHLKEARNPLTVSAKKIVLDHFATFCRRAGVATLDQTTTVHLKAWRKILVEGDLSPSSQNRWLSVMRAFLGACAKEPSRVPKLTTDGIRDACAAVAEPGRDINFLRPPQIREVLSAAITYDANQKGIREPPYRMAEVALTLLLSGMRLAELVGLEWSEVDLEAGEIRLPVARTKGQHQGRRITFDVAPTLGSLLARLHRETTNKTGRVWPRLSASKVNHALARLAMYGAPRLSSHIFRKTSGTLLTCAPAIYGAASVYQSARRLGHCVAVAARHYLGHLTNLPADAKTIEDAGGFRELAEKIANGGDAIGNSEAAQ